jgi:hypothetical protein
MVETEVRDVIRSRINDVPENKLIILRNYIDYLAGEEWDVDKEYGIPLDEYDYEMAKRADERKDEEYISFDDALKEAGLTYDDLRN